jgi:hypothetical protein
VTDGIVEGGEEGKTPSEGTLEGSCDGANEGNCDDCELGRSE